MLDGKVKGRLENWKSTKMKNLIYRLTNIVKRLTLFKK